MKFVFLLAIISLVSLGVATQYADASTLNERVEAVSGAITVGNTIYHTSSPIDLKFTFDGAGGIGVTHPLSQDIGVINGVIVNHIVVETSANSFSYNYRVIPSSDGTVTVIYPANSFTLNGVSNDAVTYSFIYDGTNPSFQSGSDFSTVRLTVGDPSPLYLKVECVDQYREYEFAYSTQRFNGARVHNLIIDTDVPGESRISYSCVDMSGNRIDGAKLYRIYSTPEPAIPTNISIVSDNTYSYLAKIDDTVTVTFDTEAGSTVKGTIDGEVANGNVAGTTGTLELTLSGDETIGAPLKFSFIQTNDLGSAESQTAVKGTGAYTLVIADFTAPVIPTNISIASDNADPTKAKSGDTVTVTFDTGTNITITTGTIGGKNATYTFNGVSGTLARTLDGTETPGVLTFSFVQTDATGNAAAVQTAVKGTGRGSSVTTDIPINISIASNNVYDTSFATHGNKVTVTFDLATGSTFTGNISSDGERRDILYNTDGNIGTMTKILTGNEDQGLQLPFSLVITDSDGDVKTYTAVQGTGTGTSVTTDFIRPDTPIHISITSDNDRDTSLAKSGDTVTVTFNTDTDATETKGTIGGKDADYTLDGTIGKLTRILNGTETPDVLAFSFRVFDHVGNSGALQTAVKGTGARTSVTADFVAPAVPTHISIASDNARDTSLAKKGDIVTITFDTDEGSTVDVGTIDGKDATLTFNGTSSTLTRTLDGTETEGSPLVFSFVQTDDTGNAAATQTAVKGTGAGTSVTTDFTAPAVPAHIFIESNNDYSSSFARFGDIVTITFDLATNATFTGSISDDGEGVWYDTVGHRFIFDAISNNTGNIIKVLSGDENANDLITFSVVIIDAAGNAAAPQTAVKGIGAGTSVTTDFIYPTVPTDISIAHNGAGTDAVLGDIVTITFDTDTDATETEGTIGGKDADYTLDGTIGKLARTLDGTESPGVLAFSFRVFDHVGNGGTTTQSVVKGAGAGTSVTTDFVAPAVPTHISIASDNADTSLAKKGDIVTITFDTDVGSTVDVGTIGGKNATFTFNGTSSTLTRTLVGTETKGLLTFSFVQTNIIGSTVSQTEVKGTGADTFVIADFRAPAIPTNILIESDNADPTKAKLGDTVTITFDTEADSTVIGTIDGKPADFVYAGAFSTLTRTLNGTETQGSHLTFSFVQTDPTGNDSHPRISVRGDSFRTSVTADFVAPVVTYAGATSVSVNQNDSYTLPDMTCEDAVDGNSALTPPVTFHTDQVGVNTIYYQCSDAAGNESARFAYTVTVVQVTPPVSTTTTLRAENGANATQSISLELTGKHPIYLAQGATYNAPTLSCIDNTTGSDVRSTPTLLSSSDTVDSATLGDYTQHYSCTGTQGTNNYDVAVNVFDSAKIHEIRSGDDVLFLNTTASNSASYSTAPLTMTFHGYASLESVISLYDDTTSQSLPVMTTILATANLDVGHLEYVFTPTSGANPHISIHVDGFPQVDDDYSLAQDSTISSPTLTLNGDAVMSLEKDAAFTDPGASCSDPEDGTLTVSTAGSVDNTAVGLYNLSYTCTDSDGHVDTEYRSVYYITDTTAPAVPIFTTLPTTVSTTPITLAGTAEADSTVTLYKGESVVDTATATSGTFEFAGVTLAEERNSFTATATDAALNVSAKSGALVITLDTAAPAAPIFTNSTTTVSSSPVTLAGTAEADSVITLYKGETFVATATATGGAFEFAGVTLAEERNSFTATATDASSNVSAKSGALVITLDTTAPVFATSTDTTDVTFGDTVPTLSTLCTDANTITVTNDAGSITFDAVGAKTVIYTCTDAAGNTAIQSVSYSVAAAPSTFNERASSSTSKTVVDGTIYHNLGLVWVEFDFTGDGTSVDRPRSSNIIVTNGVMLSASNSGTNGTSSFYHQYFVQPSSDGTVTVTYPANSFIINGASNDAVTYTFVSDRTHPTFEAGADFSTVELTVGDDFPTLSTLQCRDTYISTTSAPPSGSVNANLAGDYPVEYTCTDNADNSVTKTKTYRVLADFAAPAAPIFTNSTATVSSSPVTLAGTAEADSTVTLYKDETFVATATATGGIFEFAGVTLAEERNSFTATATDAALNVSAKSGALVITLDTAAPAAPIFTNSTATVSSSPVTLAGTAEADSTVTLYKDETSVATATATGGIFEFAGVTLAEERNSFTATATDAALNVSAKSGALVITLDTAAPAAPIFTNSTATVSSSPVTLAGTAEADSTVTLYKDETSVATATATGGIFEFAGVELDEGSNDFTATATDAALNVSAKSGALVITLDTAAPIITVDPLEVTLELDSASPTLLDGVSTDDGSTVTTTGTVDVSTVDDYTIRYDSTDGTNAATTVTRTYHVTDTKAPIITVDPLEVTLELNSASPTLLDGVSTDDGSTVTTTGTVDVSTVDDYTIRYDSTDGTNAATTVTRTYHVTDTKAPIITVDPLEVTLELDSASPTLLDGVSTDDGSTVTTTGTVDVSTVDDYTIRYDSTDGTNAATTVTRTYHVTDTKAPIITVDPLEVTLELDSASPTLLDGVSTDDGSTVTTTGTVDVSTVDDYTIRYDSTDGTNAATTVTRTYHVTDTKAPIITVDPLEVTLELDSASPTLLDGVSTDDGSTVTTTGTVDVSTVDDYTIRYDSTDGTNAATTVTRTYHVTDTKAPIITVDPLEVTLELNSASPTLLDGVSTDDGSTVTTTGTVDVSTVDDYTIRYDSTDGTNAATTVTRTYHVTDTKAPIITVDPLEVTLELNSASPTLLDGVSTDDGSTVTTTGTVDVSTVDDYTIRYDSTDGTNAATTVTRTYHVTDTKAPIITVDPLEVTLELDSASPTLLDGVSTDDGSTVTTTGTVDVSTVDDYTIRYDSTDGTNAATTVTRTYHVTDTKAPIITVDPLEVTLELNSASPTLLDGVSTDDGSTVTTTGTVDVSTVDDYTIRYDSTDGTNAATTVTRTYHVTDTKAPIITVDPLEVTLELDSASPTLLDGVSTDDGSTVTTTGTVDVSTVDDYTIRYDSTDGTNAATTVTRTYHVTDTKAPIITVDPLEVTLELNSASPTLLDGVSTDDGSTVTTTGTVDVSTVDDYTIRYDSTDGTNAATTVTRTYHVTDTKAPIITVDPLEVTLELNSASPTLLDGVSTDDGSTVTTTGTVDVSTVDDYTIRYDSTDGTNAATTVTRTYHVTDTKAPIITVDPLEVTLELNSASPTLLDGVSTDDGSTVTTTGTVDVSTVDDYTIRYDSTDGTNAATTVTRTYHVTDTKAPIITVDPLEVTLELDSASPTLLDGVSTDDGSTVTTTGTVDVSTVDDYTIRYDSTDGTNAATTVTRTYHVTDTKAPIITVDPLEVTLELNSASPTLLDGVSTDDGSTVTTTGTVDVSTVDDYTIRYDSTDGTNAATTVTRTYHVTDTKAPIITVDPLEVTLELNSASPTLLDGVSTDDGSTVTTTGTVDVSTVDDYTIRYDSTDGTNAATTVTRTYHVTDTKAPIITVDPLEVTLELNSASPTLLDGVSTDDGSTVTTTGTVDVSTVDDYTIRYDSTDGTNAATTVTRTYHVTDTKAPIITVDPLEVTLELDSASPTLLDGVSTDDGSTVTTTGTVDVSTVDDYTIRYDSTDGTNAATTVTRTYHVTDTKAPIITVDPLEVTLELDSASPTLLDGVSTDDGSTVTTTGTVDVSTVDDYTIRYDSTDGTNAATTVTRTYHVTDTKAPIITVDPLEVTLELDSASPTLLDGVSTDDGSTVTTTGTVDVSTVDDYTIRYDSTDGTNAATTVTRTYHVTDTKAPIITVDPLEVTLELDSASPTLLDGVSTDDGSTVTTTGTVDVSTVDDYTIRYDSTDGTNAATTVTRTYHVTDTKAPIITVDPLEVTLELNSASPTLLDGVSTDDGSTVTTTGTVDVSTVDDYTIRYDSTDGTNAATTVTRTYHVTDTKAPIITVDPLEVTLELDSASPTLLDGVSTDDGSTVTTTGTVDVSTVDDYTIRYDSTDGTNAATTVTRTYHVTDTKAPIITVDPLEVTLELDSASPTLLDGVSTDDGSTVTTTGTVDVSTVDDYTIRYDSTDGTNAATTVTRTYHVTDTKAPIITVDPLEVTLELDSASPTLLDGVSTDDGSTVTTTGTVDVSTVDDYTIRYDSTDGTNAATTVTRTYHVTDTKAPIITVDPLEVTLELDSASPTLLDGVSTDDGSTVTTTGTVDVSTVDDYTIRYDSTDGTNAATTVTRTYHVTDTKAPIITVDPLVITLELDSASPTLLDGVSTDDGSTVTTTGTVDVSTVDDYTIRYDSTDGTNAATTVTRTYHVTDTKAPIITVDPLVITLELDSASPTLLDGVSTDDGSTVTTTGTVDVSTVDDYTIRYDSTDGTNAATTVTRTYHVTDTKAPIITVDPLVITLELDSASPTLLDGVSTDDGSTVTTTGTVDVSTVDDYTIRYDSTDGTNAATTVTRTYHVTDTKAPIITVDPLEVTLELDSASPTLLDGVSTDDGSTVTTTGTVDVSTVDDYTIRYDSTDGTNAATTVTRTYHVTDTKAPIITVDPLEVTLELNSASPTLLDGVSTDDGSTVTTTGTVDVSTVDDYTIRYDSTDGTNAATTVTRTYHVTDTKAPIITVDPLEVTLELDSASPTLLDGVSTDDGSTVTTTGTVDVSTVDDYTIRYDSTDGTNAATTVTRTYHVTDTKAPIITVDPLEVTLELDSASPTLLDGVSTDDGSTVTTTGTVDVSTVDDYTIRYDSTDGTNAATTVTRTYHVTDTKAPIITVDPLEVTLELDSASPTLLDGVSTDDGSTVTTTGTVDVSTVDDYTIRYDSTDGTNAATTVTRTYHVTDTKAPIITVDPLEVTLELDSASPTLLDGVSTDDGSTVTTTGTVDVSTVDDYTIRYDSTDGTNAATTVTRTYHVTDTKAPIITVDPLEVTLELNSASPTLLDGVSTDDGSTVTTTGTVDVSTVDDYTIRYDSTDGTNAATTVTRTYHVTDTKAPIITVDPLVITLELDSASPTLLDGVSTDDGSTVTTTGTVDVSTVDDYTIRYDSTDGTNAATTVTRTYHVTDTKAPIITVDPLVITLELDSASPTLLDGVSTDDGSTVTTTGTVDVSTVDDYTIRYDSTDGTNAATTVTRTYHVTDTKAPIITVDPLVITLELDSASPTLLDGVSTDDGSTVTTTGTVDVSTVDDYTIRYDSTDGTNAATTVTRTYHVTDTKAPIITVDPLEVTLELDSASPTLLDGVSTDDGSTVTTTGTVDVSTVDDYTIRYDSTDGTNAATTVTRTYHVTDTKAPIITVDPLEVTLELDSASPTLLDGVSTDDGSTVTTTGTVDVSTVDDYTIRYDSTDGTNAATTVTRTYHVTDTKAPIITVDPLEVTLELDSASPTLLDGVSTDDGSTVTTTGTVDVSTVDDYTIRYDSTDGTNAATTVTRTYHVTDTKAPIITVDPLEVTLELDSASPTLLDGVSTDDGSTVTTTGTVDVSTVDDYTIRYDSTDGTNAATTVTRTYHVTDTKAPIITVDPLEVTLELDSASPTLLDGVSTDDGSTVTTTGTVDVSTVDDYTIRYDSTDGTNAATTVTRTYHVTDTKAPIITVDPLEVTLELDSASPTLLDGVSTDDGSTVTTTGTVDVSTVDDYTIRYDSTDGTNAATTVTRTYHVTDTKAPIITVDPLEVTLELDSASPTLLDGVSTDDGSTVTTTGTVDVSTVDDYTIRYDSTDGTNAATTVTRTYHVTDTTAPIITVDPLEVTLELDSASPTLLDGVSTDDGSTVTTTGTVDVSTVDDYTIRYDSTDGTNAATTVTRTYHVTDTKAPIITVDPLEVTLELDSASPTLLDGVSTDDGSTVTTTGTVDVSTVDDYTIRYDSTDGTNAATTVTRTYHVTDTKAPAIPVFTNSTATVSSSPVTLAGTAEADSTVTLYKDETSVATATATGGIFEFAGVTLAEERNSFTATATDASSNVSAKSGALVITLDTVPPSVPTFANTITIVTSTPITITGLSESDSIVKLFDDGTLVATVTATSGTFEFTGVALDEGVNYFTLTASDGIHTTEGDETLDIALDTTPPVFTDTSTAATAKVGDVIPTLTCTDPGGGRTFVFQTIYGNFDTAVSTSVTYTCTDVVDQETVQTVVYDVAAIPPAVPTDISIASDNADDTKAKSGDIVTVTFDTVADSAVKGTIGGKNATFAFNGTSSTLARTLDGTETSGVLTFSFVQSNTGVDAATQTAVKGAGARTSVTADFTKPVITPHTNNPVFATIGDPYTIPTLTCTDNLTPDKDATPSTISIDTASASSHTVTYSCTDDTRNAAVDYVLTVNVVALPTTSVEITPIPYHKTNIGTHSFTIILGDDATGFDPTTDVTLSDGGRVDSFSEISGTQYTVNTADYAQGAVTITVQADAFTDFSNAETSYLFTYDTTKPVIVYAGDNPVSVNQDADYDIPSLDCTDNIDTTKKAQSSGTVDTGTVADHTINYSCIDLAGNTATPLALVVNVITTPAIPVIITPPSTSTTMPRDTDLPVMWFTSSESHYDIYQNQPFVIPDDLNCHDAEDGTLPVSTDSIWLYDREVGLVNNYYEISKPYVFDDFDTSKVTVIYEINYICTDSDGNTGIDRDRFYKDGAEIKFTAYAKIVPTPSEPADPPKKKKGDGSNDWHKKPTFGKNHLTHKQIIDNGFTFNDYSLTITDNWHTDFVKTSSIIGDTNTVKIKTYAADPLKWINLYLGVPRLGHISDAESEIHLVVSRDYSNPVGYTIDEINHYQDEGLVNVDDTTASLQKAKCQASDNDEKCYEFSIDFTVMAPLHEEVVAISAMDDKRRQHVTYINEGVEFTGTSLLDAHTAKLMQKKTNQGQAEIIELTQQDRRYNVWEDQHGYLWTLNEYGTWTQITAAEFERHQDGTGNVMTRQNSNFASLIEQERQKALLVFDSGDLISELDDYFAYDYSNVTSDMSKLEKYAYELQLESERAQKYSSNSD